MLGIILFIIALSIIWYQLSKKPENFPPGPTRWPIIGNVLLLKSKQSYEVAGDVKSRYGNVAGFYLFSHPIVLVSGLQEIKEALAKPELQGRPLGAIRELEDDNTGIIFTEGTPWQEQRRFTLRHLRELGMGRHTMEDCIREEARALMKDARRLAGDDWRHPVPVHELISASGVNIILQLLASHRFERFEPRMTQLMSIVRSLTSSLDSTGGIANAFPFLLKYLPSFTEYPAIKVDREKIRTYCRGIIKNHEENMDIKNTEDLVYFYLQQIKKEENESFNTKQLIGVIKDLFVAGSDTTTGALAYGILHAVLNPDIQAKIQHELDAVVGTQRLPTTEDKLRLPYSEATALEILRFANVVPLSVPHSALSDTNFRGYFIPKGTRILLNLYDLHMDANYWGDPQVFRPERFLDENGRVRRDEALLPFGQGKRSCVGESLARTNLFITLTSLLQNFTLALPEGQQRPSTKHMGGITVTTPPFSIIMTPRNSSQLY